MPWLVNPEAILWPWHRQHLSADGSGFHELLWKLFEVVPQLPLQHYTGFGASSEEVRGLAIFHKVC